MLKQTGLAGAVIFICFLPFLLFFLHFSFLSADFLLLGLSFIIFFHRELAGDTVQQN